MVNPEQNSNNSWSGFQTDHESFIHEVTIRRESSEGLFADEISYIINDSEVIDEEEFHDFNGNFFVCFEDASSNKNSVLPIEIISHLRPQVESSLKEKEAENRHFQDQIRNLNNELERLRGNSVIDARMMDEMRNRLRILESENEYLRNSLEESEEEHDEQVESLQNSFRDENRKVMKLTAEVNELKEIIKMLKERNSGILQDIADAKSSLENAVWYLTGCSISDS